MCDDDGDPITTVAIPGIATAVLVPIAGEVLRPIIPEQQLHYSNTVQIGDLPHVDEPNLNCVEKIAVCL